MGNQHTVETVTPVVHRRWPLTATTIDMYNSKHGNVKPRKGVRSFQCTTCLREFPSTKIVMVDGRPYCTPFHHYEDPMHDNALKNSGK